MSEFQSTGAPNAVPSAIENLDLIRFEGFSTLNTKPTRLAIKADEMYICDNFMPVGKDNLKSLPGSSYMLPLFTVPNASSHYIISFYFFNIGTVQYFILFYDDGGGDICTYSNGTSILTIAAGTFPSGTNYFTPECSQYGSQYLVIAATTGYYTYNGTTFMTAASPAGTSIEMYLNRVWITQGANIIYSAPSSPSDFSSTNGGGTALSIDSFLRVGYTKLLASNGYLYVFADSSINYISNLAITSAVPPVTTFKNTNIDPQIGTIWPDTIETFSRNINFVNAYGIHSLVGGTVTKVSTPLDTLFQKLPAGIGVGVNNKFTPSACQAVVYGEHIYVALIPIYDQISGIARNALLMTDGQRWWTGSQETTLTYIGTQEINSVFVAFATDGKKLFSILTNYNATLVKTVQSKYWSDPSYVMTKDALRIALLCTSPLLTGSPNVTVTLDVPSAATPISINTASYTDPRWTTYSNSGQRMFISSIEVSSYLTGLTITTNEPNFTLQSVTIGQMQHNLEM